MAAPIITCKMFTQFIFKAVLANLKKGDTLVVWSLDRAFRSTVETIQHADLLRERGIDFHIVSLGAHTSTADGMLGFTVRAAMNILG